MRGVVVVDLPNEEQVVIWQVSPGDGLESAMAGAWVLPEGDERIAGLLAGQLVIATPAAESGFGSGAGLSALAQRIDAEIDVLNAAFTAYVSSLPSSRRKLARPPWPEIAHEPTQEVAGDPVASGALTLARWASKLLTAWDEVEKARLARPYLVARGGEVARELPPGWPLGGTEQAA